MNKTVTLCWACEDLFKQSYDMKRVNDSKYRPKAKAASCGYCGKRMVAMNTFEITPKRRRPDVGA